MAAPIGQLSHGLRRIDRLPVETVAIAGGGDRRTGRLPQPFRRNPLLVWPKDRDAQQTGDDRQFVVGRGLDGSRTRDDGPKVGGFGQYLPRDQIMPACTP